jgi:KEOPS complex subunit Cgi121
MIRIVGAKGTIPDIDHLLARISQFAENQQVAIQVMDANVVYGKNHLVSAAEHAIRAFTQKTNTMNSLAMETLLYASGERQIKLGIQKMGVKPGKGDIAFVFIDKQRGIAEAQGNLADQDVNTMLKTLQLVRDDSVLEGDEDTLRQFGISDEELETVTKAKYGYLILEKVALVDIIK